MQLMDIKLLWKLLRELVIEKQKVKFIYGVLEKQFRSYYEKAERKQGITGELLLQELERRLDSVVFRMGYASTRREARQLVNHGHFTVNGKRVNIPSYQVRLGDVVAVSEKFRASEKMKALIEEFGKKPMHFFGLLGSLMFFIGFIALLIVLGMKLASIIEGDLRPLVTSSPYFYVSLAAMILGTQLFLAGFIGELISRSSPNRNNYKIETEL